MASIYRKKGSAVLWLRYKDDQGVWRGRPTSYRAGHKGELQKAQRMAVKLSQIERERTPGGLADHWEKWVPDWIASRYGRSSTATIYCRYWRKLSGWLAGAGVVAPSQLLYRHALEYRDWRLKSAGINTAIHELKFLGVVMGEAVKRGLALANPCVRMGIKRQTAKEKVAWTDAEISRVSEAIRTEPAWMRATFLLGLYQAARLRQCAVLLSDIDLDRGRITYRQTKGNKPFTQPLDPRAVDSLRGLMLERSGEKLLCEIPEIPSVLWRQFLDRLGLRHLSHHGLRVTWITRAAKSGQITLSQAKAFVGHASTAIHSLYQKLNADDVAGVPQKVGLPNLL